MAQAQLPPQVHVFVRDWLSSNNVLLKSRDGHVLIDTGYVSHAPLTLALLASARGIGGDALAWIVNTHCHSDHIGGNAAIVAKYGCPVAVPRDEAPLVERWDETALWYSYCDQRADRFTVDKALVPGSSHVWGDLEWRALAAPGHDMAALVFHNPEHGILVSGDALWENGFGVVMPPDVDAAAIPATRATIEMIAGLGVRVVIPGHGEPFTDVAAAVERARQRITAFEADRMRVARHVLKVMLVFTLLDRRRLALAELPSYVDRIGLYRDFNRLYFRLPPSEYATMLVSCAREEHARSGARTAGSCRRDFALESRGFECGLWNSRIARPVSACHAPSLADRAMACRAELRAGRRVSDLLDHPAFQGAIAPFIVALIVASALGRTRFAWIAILPAYATMVALDTGFALSPLTVSRRSWLIALLAPLVGVAADCYRGSSRRIAPTMAAAAALVSLWVYWTLIGHHEGWRSAVVGAGIAIYFTALVAAVLRLRDDGLRCGAAGLGLGIAAGIAGILSASIGALVAGAALAAACGAMLVVQIALARTITPGFTGALPIGMIAALIAVGAQQLAELPWYALLLMLLVPLATSLPVPRPESRIARAAVLCLVALVAATLPIAAAWNAARASLS